MELGPGGFCQVCLIRLLPHERDREVIFPPEPGYCPFAASAFIRAHAPSSGLQLGAISPTHFLARLGGLLDSVCFCQFELSRAGERQGDGGPGGRQRHLRLGLAGRLGLGLRQKATRWCTVRAVRPVSALSRSDCCTNCGPSRSGCLSQRPHLETMPCRSSAATLPSLAAAAARRVSIASGPWVRILTYVRPSITPVKWADLPNGAGGL
jgi:hypothetical protein